jgi:NADP-dependent 3-hydroxy acid dehydrogenase YdfG
VKKITLAYCRDNTDLAAGFQQQMRSIGLAFDHLTDAPEEPIGQFCNTLERAVDQVLLLVTDNFLKSAHCVAGALGMLEKLHRRSQILVITAPGYTTDPATGIQTPVNTAVDRLADALRYMNYWQNDYLSLIDAQQHLPAEQRNGLEGMVQVTHDVANEVGQFIDLVRQTGYLTWEQFAAHDYERFFQHFQLIEWHGQYRALSASFVAEATAPVVEIPSPTVLPPTAGLVAFRPVETAPVNPVTAEELSETPELPQLSPEELALDEELVDDEMDFQVGVPEIEQTIRDAWGWLDKGHVELGLQVFQAAFEQHPHDMVLRTEYQQALALYQPDHQLPPLPEASPADPDDSGISTNDDEFGPAEEPPVPADGPEEAQPEAKSYDLMGDIAVSKGDFLFAKYCWDRVIEVEPTYPGIYRKLGLLASEHLPNYAETAAHYLSKAIGENPDDVEVWFKLGDLQWRELGQYAPAEQSLQRVTELQPENAEAWLMLAEARHYLGVPAEAALAYDMAIQIDPQLRTPERDAHFLLPPAALEMPEDTVAINPEPTVTETEPVVAPPATDEKILTVLITGATSGIGQATAEVFARAGHRLILTGRREERLTDLHQYFLQTYNTDVLTLPFDVRHQPSAEKALLELPDNWRDIDLLVNNAGLAKGLSPIYEGNLDHWETMIDTNIKGLLYMTRLIAPHMVQRRQGHIINIGSIAGKDVYPNGNVYCATKAAVDALTRAMRQDLYQHNIRVSQICPGAVEETEFSLTRFEGDAQRAEKVYEGFQPLRSTDVAELIYFMATRPAHVNIQDMVVYSTQQASATMVDRSGRANSL